MRIMEQKRINEITEKVKLEDFFYPKIYISFWINHAYFYENVFSNLTLAVAVRWSKREIEDSIFPHFFNNPCKDLTPHFYAGTQRKWVWMNQDRVSISDPIPFTYRTVGITRRVDVCGVEGYWREPKNK